MTRFFFDVVRNNTRTYDFHGQYLNGLNQAREMAEIVSYDLACADKDDCSNCEIQVRDAAGAQLFSLPVLAPEVAFA